MDISIYTLIIIALNVLCSFKGFKDRSFFETYKFNVGGIKRGEKLRMLVSGFLHVDLQHLLFNMITLYFFADQVIYRVGSFYFFLIYFGSLIFGNLLSYYFHKNESLLFSCWGEWCRDRNFVCRYTLCIPWHGIVFCILFLFLFLPIL